MTLPTSRDDLYRWHREAMDLNKFGIAFDVNPQPECGWFKRRLVKGGPFVPAKIWMHQPVGEDGHLCDDEILQCEVDGLCRDPSDQWSWLAGNPISEAEFKFLTATRQWAEQNSPDEPYANPQDPVDWHKVPTPTF